MLNGRRINCLYLFQSIIHVKTITNSGTTTSGTTTPLHQNSTEQRDSYTAHGDRYAREAEEILRLTHRRGEEGIQ